MKHRSPAIQTMPSGSKNPKKKRTMNYTPKKVKNA